MEAIALVSLLGGGFGTILAVAGRKLAVETDPRIEAITNNLPGANCGCCGYPGCSGLAEAIVAGKADASPCPACTPDAKRQIAGIMGLAEEGELDSGLRKVARLACNGCKQTRPNLFDYHGVKNCHLVAKYFGGPGKCNFGCLGFGACADACPFHAIQIGSNGLPVINYDQCVGCGICVKQCPQMVLHLTDANIGILLQCNNREKGKAAMSVCSASCISCGACVRVCPNQAISLQDDANGSLPVIDYSRCTACGLCVDKCPRHCLQTIAPVTGAPVQQDPERAVPSGCAACAGKESCGIQR